MDVVVLTPMDCPFISRKRGRGAQQGVLAVNWVVKPANTCVRAKKWFTKIQQTVDEAKEHGLDWASDLG